MLQPILTALLRNCQVVASWQQECVGRQLGGKSVQDAWVQMGRSQANDIDIEVTCSANSRRRLSLDSSSSFIPAILVQKSTKKARVLRMSK